MQLALGKGILPKLLILAIIFFAAFFLSQQFLASQTKTITQTINYSDLTITKTISFSSQRMEEYSFDLANPIIVFIVVPKSVATNTSQIKSTGDFTSELIQTDPILLFTSKDYSPGEKVLQITSPIGDTNKTTIAFVFPLSEYNKLTQTEKDSLKQTIIEVSTRGEPNFEINESQKVMQNYADGLKQETLSQKNLNEQISKASFAGTLNLFSRAINSIKNSVKTYPSKEIENLQPINVHLSTPVLEKSNLSVGQDFIEFTYQGQAVDLTKDKFFMKVTYKRSDQSFVKTGEILLDPTRNNLSFTELVLQTVIANFGEGTFYIDFYLGEKKFPLLLNGNPIDQLKISVTDSGTGYSSKIENTNPEWPYLIELGVTSVNPTKIVLTDINYPVSLRSDEELNYSMDVPRVDISQGIPYAEEEIPGIKISVLPGLNGEEPHTLTIQADYDKLTQTNPELPDTLDFNIYLHYFLQPYPPPIRVKINLNKPGVVLAPLSLTHAADYASQIKGFDSILISTMSPTGVPIAPSTIAQNAKKALTNYYKKNKFTYLIILGDDGDYFIPTQDESILPPVQSTPFNPVNGSNPILSRPILDNLYYGQLDNTGYVNLAVGRIPLNDSLNIIDYLKKDHLYSEPDVSYLLYTDTDPILDTQKKIDKINDSINEIQEKNDSQSKEELAQLKNDLPNLKNHLTDLKTNMKFNDTGALSESIVAKSFAFSSYSPDFIHNDTNRSSNNTNIPIYVNADPDKFQTITQQTQLVALFSHGCQIGFANLFTGVYNRLNIAKDNQLFLMNACTAASDSGKEALQKGAALFSGFYEPHTGYSFLSFVNIDKKIGVGESLKNLINASITEGKQFSEENQFTILYGDPTIVYPTAEPTTHFSNNSLIVPKVSKYDLFRFDQADNQETCINAIQEDENNFSKNWNILFTTIDGNKIYSKKFDIMDANKEKEIKIDSTMPLTISKIQDINLVHYSKSKDKNEFFNMRITSGNKLITTIPENYLYPDETQGGTQYQQIDDNIDFTFELNP
ncbi:MAG: C25 family cysteine peptidase, partial [archaeon]